MADVRLVHGDCLAVLPTLADGSVDAVVTDPPYGLDFMGREWDHGIPGASFWSAVLHALKPGGYMLAMGGTRTYHRLACAVEDAGFEIRDCLMWLYGCLSEDSELLTSEGWIPYRKITTNHHALAYNPAGDSFAWERVQEVVTYDYSDTAFRIQSDHTDQIVSRNHRCLVERGGGYSFQYAEALQPEEVVPVLEGVQDLLKALPLPQPHASVAEQGLFPGVRNEGDFQAPAPRPRRAGRTGQENLPRLRGGVSGATAGSPPAGLLFQAVQRGPARPRLGQARSQGKGGLDGGIATLLPGEDEWPEQPGVERGRDLLQQARPVRGREVCPLPDGFPPDGPQRRLCGGTPTLGGAGRRPVSAPRRGGASHGPRPDEQRPIQPDVVCQQPGPQAVRASQFARTDLARIVPFHYVGTVWCIRVPSGAFVARRNGKVFVTGNSGFPKGKGCLKPAWEPILLARKPGAKVLPLGVDECRVPAGGPTARPPLSTNKHEGYRRPWNDSLEARAACEARRAEAHDKRDALGRYPANVVHDGSEEVLAAFAAFGKHGGSGGARRTTALGRMNDDRWEPKEQVIDRPTDTGTAARFFYCAKASRRERGKDNVHPTVKPQALVQWLVKLVCPPGGTVLDPFAGSGSTAVACVKTGRACVAVEREEEYCRIAERRIAEAEAAVPLFAEEAAS